MSIPVVILHRGISENIPSFAIRQAQEHNDRVILLGDVYHTPNHCEYYPISDYMDYRFQTMLRVYQHMHMNKNAEYRLNNILRWFVIADFMNKQDIPVVFAADSDLLLFSDVTEIQNTWTTCNALLCIPRYQEEYRWAASGHASFWKLEALKMFCDFAINCYCNKYALDMLKRKWEWHKKYNMAGGICDMTLLYRFYQTYPGMVGNLLEAVPPRHIGQYMHAFDLSLNTSENCHLDEYEMETVKGAPYGQIKRLFWNNQVGSHPAALVPYGNNLKLGGKIRFDGLHFQAGAKQLMEDFVYWG